MHRNTYLLVTFLAVVAALLIGVNVGQTLNKNSQEKPKAVTTTAPTPTPVPITPMVYTNKACGFTLTYPSNLTKLEDASGSAVFSDPSKQDETIVTTCQAEIPRPPLPADRIVSMIIESASTSATVSARLYHDASPKDGMPIDSLIFTNPRNGLDVFIAGFGPVFDDIIKTVKLFP